MLLNFLLIILKLSLQNKGKIYFLIKLLIPATLPLYIPPVIGPKIVFLGNIKNNKKFHNGK